MLLQETKTSICNKALALLGEQPINSIEDETNMQARVCRLQYDMAIQSVLEGGKWPFATVEEPIRRIEALPLAKEQKYIYQIPNNCVLIVDLKRRYDRKHMRRKLDWDIRFDQELGYPVIICNGLSKTSEEIESDINQDEQILIEYICDTGKAGSYPAMFVRCVSAQLAADICMPITHDVQKFTSFTQYAAQLKEQALMNVLNEDGQDRVHWVDPITASRGW